jgi:hypothetical protein
MSVNIHIVNYKPIKGPSFIPLPAKLAAKKATVNVQNNDNKCFMWSVLAAHYPEDSDMWIFLSLLRAINLIIVGLRILTD